jgi:hypothetical protein
VLRGGRGETGRGGDLPACRKIKSTQAAPMTSYSAALAQSSGYRGGVGFSGTPIQSMLSSYASSSPESSPPSTQRNPLLVPVRPRRRQQPPPPAARLRHRWSGSTSPRVCPGEHDDYPIQTGG